MSSLRPLRQPAGRLRPKPPGAAPGRDGGRGVGREPPLVPDGGLSLWETIRKLAPPSEADELRSIVGAALFDKAEDLRKEVEALEQILQDVRADEERELSSTRAKRTGLPENQTQKELITDKIALMLGSLRKEGGAQGVMQGTTDEERRMIEYVLKETKAEKRHSAVGRRPSAGASGPQAGLMGNPTALRNKLNINDVESIVSDLREILKAEIQGLLHDVELLQQETERKFRRLQDSRSSTPDPAPSMSDLKQLSAKIEKEWLGSASKQHPLLKPVPPAAPRRSPEKLAGYRSRVAVFASAPALSGPSIPLPTPALAEQLRAPTLESRVE